MRVMTAHTAVFLRGNTSMNRSQVLHRQIVTVSTDAGSRQFGLAQLRRMRIVAGATVALYGRSVADPVGPELINVMATETKSGLLFQQVVGLRVAMCIVTDRTVLMPARSFCGWRLFRVTGDTELPRIIGEQKRQNAAVRAVAHGALAIGKWLMGGVLALLLNRPVTRAAIGILVGNDQILVIAAVGRMTGVTIACHKRPVQIRQAEVLADHLMTVGAKRPLRLDQHAVKRRLMRQVAGQTGSVLYRFMSNALPFPLIVMTIDAKGISRFAQQGRFAGGWQVGGMADQAISAGRRGMPFSGMRLDSFRANKLEVVTVKADRLRRLIENAKVIAGMRIVARVTLPIANRSMSLLPLEAAFQISVAAEAKHGRVVLHRERLRRIRRRVAVTAFKSGHRLVSERLDHFRVIRGMHAVTIGTAGLRPITAMLGSKLFFIKLMALTAEFRFVGDQQFIKLATMGFMAGFTAGFERFMNIFPSKCSLVMTLETECLGRLIQQCLPWSVVRLVTGRATPFLNRLVQDTAFRQALGERLVTGKTELRFFDFQIGSADQAVLAMTANAIA